MDAVKLYFSDFFDVDEDIIEGYGAVNISLINDLPLFIDLFCCLTVVTNNFRKYMRKLSSIFYFCKNKLHCIPVYLKV